MNILLPALSPTMEQGNLVKWLVKEGQQVNSGDILAEIETDKATMELESPDDGTIQKIIVEEGAENIPVNSPIAVLKVEGEDEETSSNLVEEEKPIKTELEISKNIQSTSVNMSSIFNKQTSLSSGNTNIRIQGLDGLYTQLLRDGFPLYGGFSSGLSILQIPPLDLQHRKRNKY